MIRLLTFLALLAIVRADVPIVEVWRVPAARPVWLITGGSMAPTLRTGDAAVIDSAVPYEALRMRDVVIFTRAGRSIVHRIVAGDERGWITRGDANADTDGVMTREEFAGRVVAVWRLRGRKD